MVEVTGSSTIHRIVWHSDKTLDVWLKDGTKVRYLDVPEKVYKEFLAQPSVGNYYNHNIRGHYKFEYF